MFVVFVGVCAVAMVWVVTILVLGCIVVVVVDGCIICIISFVRFNIVIIMVVGGWMWCIKITEKGNVVNFCSVMRIFGGRDVGVVVIVAMIKYHPDVISG